jgi:uncharacterized protein YacL
MSKLIVWRFLTSNLRTNKADIKEINLKLIKVTPSYGISTIPTNSHNLNNLDHLADLRISPRLAAIAITEELSSPVLGGTASK